MHPECKKQVNIWKIAGYIADIVLALLVFYAAVYLLQKGSIHYRPESQWPLGIMTGLPLVLRPRKKATAAELLLHDVLVLLAASSFGLLPNMWSRAASSSATPPSGRALCIMRQFSALSI